jgi:alpha-galactosidase/6-phospho-beta-glucosidase family protein
LKVHCNHSSLFLDINQQFHHHLNQSKGVTKSMTTKPSPSSLKIAYIGGGSREWARKLMNDLSLCPELAGEVMLYDIDVDSAKLNEQLGNWMQDQPGVLSRWRYTAEPDLKTTLEGANFVVISIQPGSLELMASEIALAESYGLFYPVGDTTGAPGLSRGLRSVVIYKEFAEAINTYCPDAWVINYTNPMSVCTRTLTRVAPKLKVFGCCHEVFATQRMLADIAAQYLQMETPPRNDIQVNVLGINHFTWVNRATYQDQDLIELLFHHLEKPGILRYYSQEEVVGWDDWFHSTDLVKFTLLLRFKILAAAGDRHLVEFLPGLISSPELLFKWGIIRTPVSYRISRWETAPQKTRDLMSGVMPFIPESSGEESVGMIKALLGLGNLFTNVNLENTGQISNLPLHAVVETNAHFSRDNVRAVVAGPLPQGIAALINQHITNQELIIDAALLNDTDLAFQAFINDPSIHLPIDSLWELFKAILLLNRDFLSAPVVATNRVQNAYNTK